MKCLRNKVPQIELGLPEFARLQIQRSEQGLRSVPDVLKLVVVFFHPRFEDGYRFAPIRLRYDIKRRLRVPAKQFDLYGPAVHVNPFTLLGRASLRSERDLSIA